MTPLSVVGNIMFSVPDVIEGTLLGELGDQGRHQRFVVALGFQLQPQLATGEVPAGKLCNRSLPRGVRVPRLGFRLSRSARAPTPESAHELARGMPDCGAGFPAPGQAIERAGPFVRPPRLPLRNPDSQAILA